MGGEMRKDLWRPRDLLPYDVVGVLATPDGHMLIYVNNELRVMAQNCPGLDKAWSRPAVAALDLDGCTRSVRFLPTNGMPPIIVQKEHARFREEEYSFKYTGPDELCVQDLCAPAAVAQ